MDTTTPAAGSAPAPSITAPATSDIPSAPAAPVVPAVPSSPAPVAAPTAQDVLSVMSPAERRDVALGKRTVPEILASKAGKPAPAAAAAPAPETTPAPAPEPAAAQPAAPAAPQQEEDDLKRMRVTPNDFKEREVIRLMKAKHDPQGNVIERGLTLQEAYLKVYGAPAAPAATPAAQPGAPAAPASDPALQGYDARITELGSTIKKLSEDRAKAREDVDADKADQLSDQIADARAELKILTNERQGYVRNSEQSAVQTFQGQVTASRDRALAPHPELQAEGSLHRLALDAYVQRALNDPARANEWSDPKWPERLIGEFTSKHGLKAGSAASTPAPATAPAAPATPATPTPPTALLRQPPRQVPGAKLVTSADGAQPSARTAPTMDDLRAALPQMTAEQRRGLAVRAMANLQATR